jgi:hypothetical protein
MPGVKFLKPENREQETSPTPYSAEASEILLTANPGLLTLPIAS